MTKSKYLSNTRLQVLLMMVKKAQKTVSILGTTKRMLAQDHEIHKQISWEPHGVVTYVQKKLKIQNWLYAQFKCYSTYYLSFSQLGDDSINNVNRGDPSELYYL